MHDLLGRRALEAEMAELEQQALLQIARRHADRIEALHVPQRPLDGRHGPGPIAASSSNDATR